MKSRILLFLIASIIFTQCSEPEPKVLKKKKSTPHIAYTYVDNIPHDTNAFTEGFVMANGKLYESTGSPDYLPQTQSLFGVVDTTSGEIDVAVRLDKSLYFGEGITILDGKIYQLTYTSQTGFVYDESTHNKIATFNIPAKEGWGLTTNGNHIIMSDGTYTLRFLDPKNLSVIKQIEVSENGYAKVHLNELEYFGGYIYANIWLTNTIVKIDPKNGHVVGKLDLSALANDAKKIDPNAQEMNGIAYDAESKLVYITGKMWPKTYRIQLN
jgi:glutamine cyclotransferase